MILVMIAALIVLVFGIGARVRALVFTGIGFLFTDLTAMIVHGTIDHPDLLWLVGILIGSGVVTLGAICENNREKLLQRVRTISATLQTWN